MTDEVAPQVEEIPAPTPAPEPTPEPAVVEPVVEVAPVVEEVVVVPEPVVQPAAKSKNEHSAKSRGSKTEVVHTSALVHNSNSYNSTSVALVQERLIELGHVDAGSDRRGHFSDGTFKALAEFAGVTAEKLDTKDAKVLAKLFSGTSVEVA